jgi:hypothetical protein
VIAEGFREIAFDSRRIARLVTIRGTERRGQQA